MGGLPPEFWDPCRLSLGKLQPFPQRVALRSTPDSPGGCTKLPRRDWSSPPTSRQEPRLWALPTQVPASQGAGPTNHAACMALVPHPGWGGGARACGPRPKPAGESPPETTSECGEGLGALIAHLLLQGTRPWGEAGMPGSLRLIGRVASLGRGTPGLYCVL